MPSGAAATVLALLATTIGMLVVAADDAADVTLLAALLSLGQLLGHALLGTVGHAHATVTGSPGLMLAAHVAAVSIGTALIVFGGHLCDCVSHVLRANVIRIGEPVASAPSLIADSADQPLRSALLLAASISHRGPPVSLAC